MPRTGPLDNYTCFYFFSSPAGYQGGKYCLSSLNGGPHDTVAVYVEDYRNSNYISYNGTTIGYGYVGCVDPGYGYCLQTGFAPNIGAGTFLLHYSSDGTDHNAGCYPDTTVVVNSAGYWTINPFPCGAIPKPAASGTIPWHAAHSVRLTDRLSLRIDLADGHADLGSSDLNVPGRGPILNVGHVWDSTLAQAGITSTAGAGWLTSLTPSMGGVLTGTVVYTSADGSAWSFAYAGSLPGSAPFTSYQGVPGQPWQLSANNLVTSTVGYTLSNILTGEILTFDQQGRYLADTDAYGNANTLSYGASGPISFTNSGGPNGIGRALALTYTAGLLSELTSPLWRQTSGAQGQRVTYGYTNTNQLASLTWGAGSTDALTATFGYIGTQLVTVTTPFTQAVHAWVLGYDGYGRVVSITSPVSGTAGQAGYTPAYATSFAYNPGQTIVTQGAGTSAAIVTTYLLDGQGEVTDVQDALGHVTQSSYDADHDVVTSVDGDGNTTTNYYQYVGPGGPAGLGSVGQVTETLQPAISPDFPGNTLTPISTTYSYDPSSHDLTGTVDNGTYQNGGTAITLYGYDGHHGVITTTQELGTYCPLTDHPPTAPVHGRSRRPPRPYDPLCTREVAWRAGVDQYDAYGERVAAINGNGVDAGGPTVLGQLPTAMLTNPISFTHSYTYTPQGDLAAEWTPPIQTTLGGITTTASVTTSYGDDGDGNQVVVTSTNGFATTTGYDHLGRSITTTLPPVTLSTGQVTQPVQSTGYDGEGNVVRQTDADGNTSNSSYDPLGRLVSTVNPVQGMQLITYSATEQVQQQDELGNVSTSSYDAAGRVITATDPLSGTTSYGYDAVGNVTAITSGTPGAPLTVETKQYDAQNRVVTDTVGGPVGAGVPPSTTVTGYDYEGNVAQVQQPNGDVVFNSYDDVHQLLQTILSPGLLSGGGNLPSFTTYNYDMAGNVTSEQDADQRVTVQLYDGDNRLGQTQTYNGDSSGVITTTLGYDPDGNTISRLITQTVGFAPPTTQSYTATVNAADWTTSTNDNGLVTAYGYDAAGQERSRTLPGASATAQTLFDAEMRPISITESYSNTYGYNLNDLPITASLDAGLIAENGGYDANNRPITLTLNGPGLITASTTLTNSYAYSYNPLGWTTGLTPSVSGVVSPTVLTHDVLGRLTQVAGPPGEQWVTQTSGITTNLKGVACPSTTTCIAVGDGGVILGSSDGGVTWAAQSSGTTKNLTAISCPSLTTCFVSGYSGTILATTNGGATWSSQSSGTTISLLSLSCPTTTTCYAVGYTGKLLKTTNGSTWTVGSSGTSTDLWGVSCASTTTCIAVGSSGTIIGTTDGSTWASQNGTVSYDLRADWCPSTTVCYAAGITGTIETTTDGSTWEQEQSGTTQYFAGVMCPSVSECLVAAGNGTLRFTANGGAVWAKQVSNSTSYLRDPSCADLSTCVVVGDNGTILTSSGRATYTYDGNGNLLTSSTYGVTTTYGYSAAITPNEVLTVTTPGQLPTYYGYDQNGDTTAITNGSSLTTTLQYDSQARPITITLSDGTLITQTYNSAGQRASYTVSKNGVVSESEQFSYQGDQLAQAVISNTQAYTDSFLYNGNGAPLELLRKVSGQNATRYWYVEDGRGNVVAVLDVHGNVVDRYYYDVWGRLIGSSESAPQRLRYGGYWYDAEPGWYWVSVRYYDPNLKRWLQPDPNQIDGVRTYAYVDNDPVDATDPSGTCLILLHSETGSTSGPDLGFHTYLTVTDNTTMHPGVRDPILGVNNTTYVFEGRKDGGWGPGGLWGATLGATQGARPEGKGARGIAFTDDNHPYPGMSVTDRKREQVIQDDTRSCSCYIAEFRAIATAIMKLHLSYESQWRNSNSVVYTLVHETAYLYDFGYPLHDAPTALKSGRWAPGLGHDLIMEHLIGSQPLQLPSGF
jgi:RHS repeat-associated protein